MGATRFHVLAIVAGLSCGLFTGCVLTSLRCQVSPVPPYLDLTILGLDDRVTPTPIVPVPTIPLPPEPAGTAPAATAPAGSQP